eukprot:6237-Heterococcus_DN1.PRE.1
MDADARTALLRELGVTTLPFCARVSRNGTSFTVVPKHFTVEQHVAEGDAAAHHTAALELYEAGDAAGALYSFSLALAADPTHTSAAYNAGVLLHSVGLSLLAVPFLAAVVEHTPQDATAHSVLGTVLYSCEPAAVIAAYRAVVASHLGEEAHALSAHRLAALAGEGPSAVTADPAYVRQVFDRLAPSFEGTLVDHLQYRVPWQLLEAVTSVQPPPAAAAAAAAKAAAVPAVVEPAIAAAVPVAQAENSSSSDTSTDFAAGTGATAAGTTTADCVDASTAADSVTAAAGWRVLDLGCGSGLCGRLFHEYTAVPGGHCTGVDLSPKMVELSRQNGGYHTVLVRDVHDALRDAVAAAAAAEAATAPHSSDTTTAAALDLILSADTFIYVGQLDLCFELSARALRTGGLFAFSIELLADAHILNTTDTAATASTGSSVSVHSSSSSSVNNSSGSSSSAIETVGFKLVQTGRYAHTEQYIEQLA